MPSTTRKPFDVCGFVIEYESGDITPARFLQGFSHLIKSGQARSLQGHYGRTAAALIESRYISRQGKILKTIPEA